MLDFTTCRTCLTTSGEMVPIFSKDYHVHNLSMKLYQTTQIEILEDDELPKMICKKCIFLVDSLYCFKYQCEKAELKLRKKLNSVHDETNVLENENYNVGNLSDTVISSDEEYHIEYASVEAKREVENARKQKHKTKKKQNKLPVEVDLVEKTLDHERGNLSDSDDRSSLYGSNGSKIYVSQSVLKQKKSESIKESSTLHTSTKSGLKRKLGNQSSRSPKASKKLDFSEFGNNKVLENFETVSNFTEEISPNNHKLNMVKSSVKILQNSKVRNESHNNLKMSDKIDIFDSKMKSVINHSVIITPPICALCSESFESYLEVLKHKIKVHLNQGQSQFFCPICYEKFYSNTALITHLDEHTNVYSHLCLLCSGTFYTKETLRSHLNSHVDPISLKCLICSTKAKNINNLLDHLEKHINNKKLLCTLCTNSYDNKDQLQSHIDEDHKKLVKENKNFSVPENEKILDNSCSQCEETFPSLKLLRNHMQTHTGAKQQYVCLICDKDFTSQEKRTQHMQEHMTPAKRDNKKFRCRVCHEILVSRVAYGEHLKKEHWNTKQTSEILQEISDSSMNEQANKVNPPNSAVE